MAELDLDRWTELYRQTCSLPRADPGGFSDALELAALAASELRRVRAERDGVRAELTRMAGDLCCGMCTEVSHDTFPIRHADGTTCVLAADVDTASGASEQEGER